MKTQYFHENNVTLLREKICFSQVSLLDQISGLNKNKTKCPVATNSSTIGPVPKGGNKIKSAPEIHCYHYYIILNCNIF